MVAGHTTNLPFAIRSAIAIAQRAARQLRNAALESEYGAER